MRLISLCVGVLVVIVGIAVGGPAAPATAAEPFTALAPALVQDADAEPGPALDPQTKADAEKGRSKLVVGTMAALLLGLVLWGRHLRKKKGG